MGFRESLRLVLELEQAFGIGLSDEDVLAMQSYSRSKVRCKAMTWAKRLEPATA